MHLPTGNVLRLDGPGHAYADFPHGSRDVKVDRRGSRSIYELNALAILLPCRPLQHSLPAESTASRALDRVYLPVLTWPA